jgi:predicted nucleic acid-binding protein
MSYPKLGFSVQDRQTMIQDIFRIGYFPSSLPALEVAKEDPADDQVLACALASEADWIVTGDAHLLRLGSFRGLPILRAADLLQRLEEVSQGHR